MSEVLLCVLFDGLDTTRAEEGFVGHDMVLSEIW